MAEETIQQHCAALYRSDLGIGGQCI